jgi:hypothetical protein
MVLYPLPLSLAPSSPAAERPRLSSLVTYYASHIIQHIVLITPIPYLSAFRTSLKL